ncbi:MULTISPECIES: Dabb family protein [Alphaproteobacteria]|uniref:Stress responsive protein n=2 Tax=Alphaproteobacteria TaxID=28211 RepID=A0A512HH04_9HYPH|nr:MULTISPECIES: Dabb family protein [Alphaproteobacteria]GEO84739.1 stress responsive protein [Ciceribacter naphthalenivorans]GLR20640.1 stress responsive protein [Ciceribacter naphthalenivorans]GLT03496.1 stress responsive protein [Sphingomonas psychrolutea]
MPHDVVRSSPVHHIVMWKVAGDAQSSKQDAIAKVRAEFEALRGLIPGMTRLEIGVDHSRVSYSCDMVLVTEFESEGALQAYATHPAHLAARDRLEGLRIARHQVDYVATTEGAR